MRHLTFFIFFFFVSVWGTVFGETENTLEKAEALITELKFYEALVALEPLLMSDEKVKNKKKHFGWLTDYV